jgi:hypothetical protein
VFGVNDYIQRTAAPINPGLIGDIYFGNEEVGLYQKLWQRRLLIGYVPNALMYNYIPSGRMTVDFFRRRMREQPNVYLLPSWNTRPTSSFQACGSDCRDK